MKSLDAIEIVPGRSIGEVHLGTSLGDLPSRAVVDPPGGQLDGVRFVLDSDDKVEDIWIDDIRTFGRPISYGGKPIDSGATVQQLETRFGKCSRVEGVKGGIFYNCAAGVSLATDFSGASLQLRVKPRR